jgi:hypothetical protein
MAVLTCSFAAARSTGDVRLYGSAPGLVRWDLAELPAFECHDILHPVDDEASDLDEARPFTEGA